MPSVLQESLPFPFVHYAGLYSTFIGYSLQCDSELHYCECIRNAIRNYVHDFIDSCGDGTPLSRRSLSNAYWFPTRNQRVIDDSRDVYESPDDVVALMSFILGLCHRCNQAVPSIEYGYELGFKKASFFARRFGFYIEQWLYQHGFNGWGGRIRGVQVAENLKEDAPIDDSDKRGSQAIAIAMQRELNRAEQAGTTPLWQSDEELRSSIREQNSTILCHAEDQVRNDFEFPARGMLAQSEHILYLIAGRIFGDEAVLHRARPDWLEGLELDVFVPDHSVAFEFQGHQHQTRRSFMHSGVESFEKLLSRDRRKQTRCRERGVELLYFFEEDFLTEDLVRQRTWIQTGSARNELKSGSGAD